MNSLQTKKNAAFWPQFLATQPGPTTWSLHLFYHILHPYSLQLSAKDNPFHCCPWSRS